MPDDDVMRVAAECVEQRGADAVPWLREQAELAEGLGQHETAEVWREIADAAEAMLLRFTEKLRRLSDPARFEIAVAQNRVDCGRSLSASQRRFLVNCDAGGQAVRRPTARRRRS